MTIAEFFSGLFQRRSEDEAKKIETDEITTESQLAMAIMRDDALTKSRALQIPAVKASLNLIKGAVRSIPLKLYRKNEDDTVEEIRNDKRISLLQEDTGDTLTADQMLDAMIEDYYLCGSAYCYINRDLNTIASLHYVENEDVSVVTNQDPIFKDYDISVQGKRYMPHEFFKILRDTKNGAEGVGIIKENELLLKVCYNSLKFENTLVATGGNKKGFIKSARKLADSAIKKLKEAWHRLYSSASENVVILNEGMEFQESSNTSVEMQLNENKRTNTEEVVKLFNIPFGMVSGTGTSSASEDDKIKFIDFCIEPFLKTFERAANRDLLLEEEKGKIFFSFDTTDIKKGSMLDRFKAYEIAFKNNFMLLDEIRQKENLPATGFDYLNLNLGNVLYDIKANSVFIPNTGEKLALKELKKEGENNANEN